MHLVTIWLHGVGQPFVLRFNSSGRAHEVAAGPWAAHDGAVLDVKDDFGQRLRVCLPSIASLSVIDVEKDLEAQGELALMQHRAQTAVQSKAQQREALARPGAAGLLRPQ